MRQTKAETERTRLALMDAAEDLFWRQGPARTSVVDIARTAGLTRGAFYHHFPDKPALFEALIDRARAVEKDLPTPVEGDGDDALAILRNYCLNVLQTFVEDRFQQRMFGIIMQGREALGELEPLAQRRREEIYRPVLAYQGLLEQAQRDGRLSPVWAPQTAATTLYSAMLGLVDQWQRAPDRFDMKAIGTACITQLLDSFDGRAAADGKKF